MLFLVTIVVQYNSYIKQKLKRTILEGKNEQKK